MINKIDFIQWSKSTIIIIIIITIRQLSHRSDGDRSYVPKQYKLSSIRYSIPGATRTKQLHAKMQTRSVQDNKYSVPISLVTYTLLVSLS